MSKIVLPTKKIPAQRVNPKRLVIYSKPKTGKTTAFSGLADNLIVDLEQGTRFVDSLKVEINNLTELYDLLKLLKDRDTKYKYITIDTVTALEDMIMPLAIKKYMATPMGKNFTGDNVLTLPNGAGYLYVREAFFEVLSYFDHFVEECLILSGHIKDKQIDDKGEMVMAANIDLTGKIKSLICAEADAIGYMYRKGNKTIVSFKTNDQVTCGARPEHLREQEFTVVETTPEGKVQIDWSGIFIK